jgi:signal transduction histidine kinase
MAWTWSAPQRGTVAGSIASAVVLPVWQNALLRTVKTLGRGDSTRSLCVAFAAFLTITGAAAPSLSPTMMAALLLLCGAALLLVVSSTPDKKLPDAATGNTSTAAKHASKACLQELLTSQKAATSCDRAAFARLTAHMSHELRTPLNAILGFSELMSNEVFGPLGSKAYAAYARDIHASGLSLLKSADDALAITSLLTAPEQHRSSSGNAASACLEALAFHANSLVANALTTCCTVDPDAEIVASFQAVRQLLINLIADASEQAMPGAMLSIASRTDCDHVVLLISVSGQIRARSTPSDSFSILLARTLCELTNAQLIMDDAAATESGEWHAAVRFQRVTQNDFFKAA